VTDDIVGPDIPDGKVVSLTDDQLRQLYARIELIDRHFAKCCAFQMDKCHYGDEYDHLYGYLHIAGVNDAITPFGRDKFEEWMRNR
jgi:hypothetical protein